jgi:hypothetical protein
MTDLTKGDKVRLKEPPRVPPQMHGATYRVAEVIEIRGKVHVRIRDGWTYEQGGTEVDEHEHLPPYPNSPFTVTEKNYVRASSG